MQKLLQLREECARPENKDKAVCKQLALLPGLPTADSSLPVPLPTVTTLLPSLPTVPGLPRAPVGEEHQRLHLGKRGPTVRQLMVLYDPALVSLMVPGMVMGP